jgi:tetratricopeptide (TPR) repeat protein
MLADLLGVSVSNVRDWARRGLITPVREIHRLPYFDFQEVVTARRLAELLAAGMSPAAVAAKLQHLAAFVPGVERPLTQLSIIVEGRDLLLQTSSGLIDSSGQRRLPFGDPMAEQAPATTRIPPAFGQEQVDPDAAVVPLPQRTFQPDADYHSLVDQASALEQAGQLVDATELYRMAMLESGPTCETHFALAELFYRMGDLAAARERYYCALELEPDHVEARANLGCVLAEEGQIALAIAALQGAICRHPNYADAGCDFLANGIAMDILEGSIGRPQLEPCEPSWGADWI